MLKIRKYHHRTVLKTLDNNNQLLIHATNVKGMGAVQVVSSLLGSLLRLLENDLILCIPSNGYLSDFKCDVANLKTRYYKRWLPNAVSRFLECLFGRFLFPKCDRTLVLGDLPLRGIRNQILFVHQMNLVKPKVNIFVSKSISFIIMRLIFMLNIRFIKTVIVQSDITKDYLEKSYPFLEGKIEVILLPAPSWLKPKKKSVRKKRIGLTLFYPSAGYPYKNHKIINKMYKAKAKTEKLDKLLITLNNSEMKSGIHDISWVGNLGRLNNKSCMDMYQKADALFFPSLLESYGLPLLEAMVLGLPILCSDLPYARWMCEDQAIYFDPFNPASAWDAVDDLFERLNEGWNVVWEKPLSKFPKEWDEVAVRYKNILFD